MASNSLSAASPAWRAELAANRRLQVGLALVVLIVLAYGFVYWGEAIARDSKRLAALQAEAVALKSQDSNPARWQERLAKVQALQSAVTERLWVNTSEAAAQARLRDWLTEIARSAVASRYLVTLGSVATVSGATSAANLANAASAADAPPATALRQFKASLSFDFQPQSVESALAAIEGGNQFAFVDSLSINKRARRAEINITVFARIDPKANQVSTPAPASSASAPTQRAPVRPPV
jgi:Type II secretion system (T2SS), protein M subtype b